MQTNKVKAVFFDVDGTLLSYESRSIPQSTLDALADLRGKGIRPIIASGRARHAMLFLSEHLDMSDVIALNGQRCYAGGKLVRDHHFAPQDMARLVALAQAHAFPCLMIGEKDSFITGTNPQLQAHFDFVGMQMPPYADVTRALRDPIYQFVIYTTPEVEQMVLAALPLAEPIRAASMCLDMIPAGSGKDVGMQALMAHYSIRQEETMAFGDGMNDVTMLRYAGIGVAMGNADEPLKEAADYVTRTVDEGGIAHALYHFGVLP